MSNAHESKVWITRPYDPEVVERVASQANVPHIVAQTLVGRNITDPRLIGEFLAPPNLARGLRAPAELPGCDDADRY